MRATSAPIGMTEATKRNGKRRGENLYPARFSAVFGDHALELDCPEGVWNPTPHGVHLANMLLELDFTGERVLELGTGCGIHAILLARRGAASLTLTEVERPILECAKHNLAKHDVDVPIEGVIANWTSLPDSDFDTLVANPPFGKAGKRYRRYFIDMLILDAHRLVRPGGRLVFIHSSMADVPRTMRLLEENGMSVRIVGETDGPFRDYYLADEKYLAEMAKVPGGYAVRDGVHYERLVVFEATLP